jgi:hypothetical protein
MYLQKEISKKNLEFCHPDLPVSGSVPYQAKRIHDHNTAKNPCFCTISLQYLRAQSREYRTFTVVPPPLQTNIGPAATCHTERRNKRRGS